MRAEMRVRDTRLLAADGASASRHCVTPDCATALLSAKSGRMRELHLPLMRRAACGYFAIAV